MLQDTRIPRPQMQRSSRERQQSAWSQGNWDLVLPQLLRAFCGTQHASTGEAANMLVLSQELQLSDLLIRNPQPVDNQAHSEYVHEMIERLEEAHT